ncbi:polyhydroxyalkanoic acid system family protein [Aurantiacibacter gangjinensis]|uniref:Uncharacterized protein n=1 Tax=Aurantiacibacter gangjinensis TaxID=502682 RepID=A0A0G9MM81_9SPHN|nr:polyhydroxyalkanoic acid system family protein [Aurantiacibacter gangjinensis]APE27818.1 hypothetical protein BMF35_a0989 [Aurantiacibacter gangjinensis]KLE31802.1 hypothetical protein AAW01_09920 [Aurantiacibacter gangjinensis]
MRVAIPHSLGREEVRRRLSANSHTLADNIPGGMAQVETGWPSEDRMTLSVAAMGQLVTGHVDIEDTQVVLQVVLPPALSFLTPIIESAVQAKGQDLLAPPKD